MRADIEFATTLHLSYLIYNPLLQKNKIIIVKDIAKLIFKIYNIPGKGEATMAKYINEVFKDYHSNNNLVLAEIKSMNLVKIKNELELAIISNKLITISDIADFEEFLVRKFNIESVILDVEYIDVDVSQDVEAAYKDILKYLH